MRSEWQKVKLGEILVPNGYIRGPFGSALIRSEMHETGIPVYEQQNAIYNNRNFRFYIDEAKYKEMKRFAVKTNDIIISCSGTVGKVSIIEPQDEKGIISQALLLLRCDTQKVLPHYLKYFFISPEGYNSIVSRSSGSVQVNISKRSVIESIPLLLPPIPEQKRIAAILSALDNKIELNNRMNRSLEAQAQAIFKSWFVDFEPLGGVMPEDWREGMLKEISTITMGQSPKGDTYNEDGVGAVFYQGRAEFGTRFPTRRLFTTEPKRMANEKDILLSVRAPVGDYNIATEQCCIGRGLAAIKPLNQAYSYCICLMAELQPKFNQFNGEGTVFGSINKDSLSTLKIIIPSHNVLLDFESIVSPLNNQISFNYNQSKTLSALRDTLLPKLMNGEINLI